MKHPFTLFLKLMLLALALGTGFTSRAQVTYSQVPLTAGSFNADIVANGPAAVAPATVPTTGTNADVDGGGYYFISQDYNTNTAAHTSGIPNSGAIPNAIAGYSALTYQLAPLSGNNSRRIPGGATGTGTVTFATATAAAEVYVLASSGGAAATVTMTVNYADGSTTSFPGQSVPDWFTASAAQNVFGMTARANSAAAVSPANAMGTAPFFNQVKLIIPADKVTQPIASLTFDKTSAGGYLQVVAVSIGTYPVCAAPPGNAQAVATTTSGGSTALTTACYSTSIYLSLTGLSQAGYTYQWQQSADGSTGWTDISGATGATYTATGQLAATYYRAVVSCFYGGSSVASAPVQVAQTAVGSCYCTPAARTNTSTSYTNVTAVSLAGEQSTLSHAPGTIGASPYYALYPTSTATTTLAPGSSYTLSVTVPSSARASAWVDFNQNGSFEAGEFFVLRTSGGATYGTATANPLTATIAVPAGAAAGTTRLRIRTDLRSNTVLDAAANACATTQYGQTMDYSLTLAAPVACAGTPPSTTATASVSAACPTTGFTLGLTGIAPGTTGLSYQWQSRVSGTTTFANLGAAQTSPAYAVSSQAATMDYRVVVTCTASGLSQASSPVTVTRNYLSCYCSPAGVPANEYITNVTLPGTSGFSNSSTNPTTSPTGYSDYTGSASATTTLYRGVAYVNGVSVSVRSNDTGSTGGLWIDYDHSATFEASEFIPLGSSDAIATIVTFVKDLTVPPSAQLGPTRVRVRWRNDPFGGTDACAAHVNSTTNWYGETEDYLVTIADAPTCTAPPATVAATASVSSACANGSFSLASNSIPTSLGGFSYQWQSRPAGTGAFADISGATTNPYTVTGQTAATDYQLVVSCQYGGTPVASNVVAVGQNSFDQCYCAPASTNGCGQYGAIANVKIGTLDNSSGCAAGSYTAYAPTGAATTSLNLGSTVTLTLTMASANTYRYAVWIDFNHNGTFDAAEFVASGTPSTSLTATASIVLPVESAAVLSGATRLRIRTNAGIVSYGNFAAGDACSTTYDGETEDYTITLLGQTPCSGAAPTATAAASVTSTCVNSPFALTATVPGNVTGLTYQWESSPAGTGAFAPIGGATALSYAVTRQAAATDYRVLVTCTASGQSQPSNTVSVGQVDFLTCYPMPVVGDGTNEFIRSVSVNGSSGFTNATNANATGGYADFTADPAMTTTLSRGGSYPLRIIVKSNNGGSQGALWIDYDHSATFDAGEYFRFGRSSLNGSAGAAVTLDTTLTIPNTAAVQLGATRMRVRWRNGAIAPADGQTAGATSWYGETEDYLIILADASPLPVELLHFTATAANDAVRLAWATATEHNSRRFEVERRLDEADFRPIGTVEAAGNSTTTRRYALTDANLPAAAKRAYYRLRQVDQDGTASYSEVRAVTLGAAGLTLYPNPTATAATLTGAEPGATVQVLDVLNKVVLTVRADASGAAKLELPPAQARGLYLVRTGPHTARLLLAR